MLNLRNSANVIIGLKQTLKAIQSDKAVKVYLANDADEFIKKSITEASAQKNLETIYVSTMKELGEACGIDIGASTAAVISDNPVL